MAFSDALRGNTADVVLRADTGQFNAKIDEAERNWRESIAGMSKEALKLDLAQDRLRNSLAKYGAESAQAKRATIALKDAEEQATRATDRHGRAMRNQSSGVSSLRRNVVGLAAAYVGVHGLVSGIRAVNEAYREAEVIQGQTRIGVESLGIAYDQHADKIDRVVRAVSQLGFDDEALLQSFLKLVRGTKDVDVALERMALAAGVARGTFQDLEYGTNIVVKAQLGMSGALRRTGLDVEKNATRTELLAFLTEQFGQSAVKAADDGAVAGERFAVEWENLKEILGSGVSPALADISTRLADYLGDARNQEEIQRRVNEAMETGEEIVRGFAGAMKFLRDVTKPVVDLLGGTEEAVRILLIAMAVGKVLAFARGIRLVGNNARFAAGQLTLMAAASNLPMGGGLGRFGPPGVGMSPAGLAITGLAAAGYYGYKTGQADAIDGGEFNKLADAARSGHMTRQNLESLRPALTDAQYRALSGLIDQRQGVGAAGSPDSRDGMTRGGGQGSPKTGGSGSGSGKPGPRTMADVLLDQARASTTATDADDLRFHREAAGMLQREINALEARKNLTKKQKDRLTQLYGDLASEQRAIESIIDGREDELDRQREAAARKRAAAKAAADARLEKILDAAERQSERRHRLFDGLGPLNTRQHLRDAALRHMDGSAASTTGKGLTQADAGRMFFDWLTQLTGQIGQWGSNIDMGGGPMSQVATHAYQQTHELREQSRMMGLLVNGQWHPGAQYAGNELAVAGVGIGY